MTNVPRDMKDQRSKVLSSHVTVLMEHGYTDVNLAGLKYDMYLSNVTCWHNYRIPLTCHVSHSIW